MRLDFFLCHSVGVSRKEAKFLIAGGRIRVSGEEKISAKLQLGEGHKVWLDDELLEAPRPLYLMLNKPAGYVSSTSDNDGLSVLHLLPTQWRSRLHLVGRLDADTTGLLLLTTDGDWSHRITSPKADCPKVYRVTLDRDFTDQQRQQLESGIELKGETRSTLPATVRQLSSREILLQIQEGKYHQVKRMLAAVGNHVLALHRVSIGDLALPDDLAEGQWRELTDPQIGLFALSHN